MRAGEGRAPLEEIRGEWRRLLGEERQRGRGTCPRGPSSPPRLTQQSAGLAFRPSEKEEEPAAASYEKRLPALN